jgi:predicted PurR-regulated permease PerM
MSHKAEAERVSQLVFYGTVILICWLAYRIVRPFFVEIGWAVVLAICLDPIRVRLAPRLGPTRTAVALVVASVVLLVIPVVFVGTAVIQQGRPAVAYLNDQLQGGGGAAEWFHQGWEWARARAPFLPTEQEAIAKVTASVGKVAEFLAGQAGGLLKGAANVLFSLVIVLAILFFLLRDAALFAAGVRRALPFGDEQNDRLMALSSDLVSASVTSTIAVAAVQGLIGGVTFALLGVSGYVLWGVMMFLLAFLPLVGATLVWLPAAVWLALSGSLVKGIVLALVGVLVLGNVDNVLRPLLLSGKSQMNTLVLIISLMGGVSAFGFIGIVLGPLVAAILTALAESYRTDRAELAAGTAGAPAASFPPAAAASAAAGGAPPSPPGAPPAA